MIKFARYFFIIFTLTFILPLAALFFYANRQMKIFEAYGKTHMLETARLEIQSATRNYIKLKSADIVLKLQENSKYKYTKKDIETLFRGYNIVYLRHTDKKIHSNFRIDYVGVKPQLYYEGTFPINSNSFNAIKLTQKVNFSDISINGPFQLELYSGDIISKETLAGVIFNKDILQKRTEGYSPFDKLWIMETGIPKEKNVSYKIIKMNDGSPNTKATVLIKTKWPRPAGKRLESKVGILIFLAAILTSLASTVYVSRNFVKPYLTLSFATKKVKKGNLDFTIDEKTKQKEVQNTYDSFNKMIKGLREKEELRSSFIRNLTHDLRTPLIAQERALHLISEKFKSLNLNEEVELSKSLEKNASHLLRMVNLILESYQFNLKEENLKPTNIKLKELVDDSYSKIKPLADDKNISLINNIASDFAPFVADYTCMERIFINLASNAIENLNNFGIITIGAERRNDNVVISIADNGLGIAAEDIPYVFDRYYSAKSYNRKLGSGLGLDVCKRLVNAHNGSISIDSELGKYTKIEICIPDRKVEL